MTKKEFMNSVINGQENILQQLLDLLNDMKIDYCVIGGLAVNAYVEPVVSLDLDIVVVAEAIDRLIKAVEKAFNIDKFPHSKRPPAKEVASFWQCLKDILLFALETILIFRFFIILRVNDERAGLKLTITSDGFQVGDFFIEIFHVNLYRQMSVGEAITAGQEN